MSKLFNLGGGLSPAVVRVNADGTLGVDNVKAILTVVVTFVVDVLNAIKANNYFALLTILPNLLRFGNIIDLAKAAWEEVLDTDLEESNELVAHFASVLELTDDEAEEIIEYAVSLVPRVYEFVLRGFTFVADVRAFADEVKTRFGAKETTIV
jgi:hypothetical protein